jgi:hypothetical protein
MSRRARRRPVLSSQHPGGSVSRTARSAESGRSGRCTGEHLADSQVLSVSRPEEGWNILPLPKPLLRRSMPSRDRFSMIAQFILTVPSSRHSAVCQDATSTITSSRAPCWHRRGVGHLLRLGAPTQHQARGAGWCWERRGPHLVHLALYQPYSPPQFSFETADANGISHRACAQDCTPRE